MAEYPNIELEFTGGKPDPGCRKATLPAPLPETGDDFDWHLGDFESYRAFMLAELKARFPERRRWTAADMEQVLIDIFAAAMDQLSDMADRTVAESFLSTARDPKRVYQWLQFIGEDLPDPDNEKDDQKKRETEARYKEEILKLWREKPHLMEQARRQGPGKIYKQERMAHPSDYCRMYKQHPLVLQAYSSIKWSGSWPTVVVTLHLWKNHKLLDREIQLSETRKNEIKDFHLKHNLLAPTWKPEESYYDILIHLLERYRMAGQEAIIRDVEFVGIDIALCVMVGKNYFQSEIRREVKRVLGRGPGGFFEPKRLGFGEDLHISDFYERLIGLDGVDNIRLTKFKRVGALYHNRISQGYIKLKGTEIAVCDGDPHNPQRGNCELHLCGGRKG